MDAESRYCRGCQRTLEEIARWSEMSDDERETVLAALPERKESQACAR
jgi:predicted Fe-S protein YdhL (DUF1289 family)